MKQFFLLATSMVFLFACNNSKRTSSGDATTKAPLTDTYWKLTELNGVAIDITPPNGKQIYLVMNSADKRASGNAGCNGYGGNYELNSNGFNIKFGPMIHTQMACGVIETEVSYLKMLETVDSYYVNDTALQLNRARMAPLAKFVKISGKPGN